MKQIYIHVISMDISQKHNFELTELQNDTPGYIENDVMSANSKT